MPKPQCLNVWVPLGGFALLISMEAAAQPPLPTPCLAGSCGASVSAFVSYGTAGATVSVTVHPKIDPRPYTERGKKGRDDLMNEVRLAIESGL